MAFAHGQTICIKKFHAQTRLVQIQLRRFEKVCVQGTGGFQKTFLTIDNLPAAQSPLMPLTMGRQFEIRIINVAVDPIHSMTRS